MNNAMIRRAWAGACGAAAVALLAGCDAPRGHASGRVEVSDTTRAERKSGQMAGGDLAQASDDVAMALAADINRLAEEDWGKMRVTVTFGDVKNATRAMPTTDFEYVRERIKNKLMRSKLFRDNVKFVENRARMEELNQREYGSTEDPLQSGGAQSPAVERTDLKFAFYLNGDAYGVHRDTTHLYYLAFKLNRASDGEEVFSKDYEVKYSTRR